ncbi:hypothetical protein [Roseobacter sp.]|uniref:hypothetical protein n=1 Tax=Roseobacter sp. TaxID=1907202 RepID=UPI00398FD8E6
MLTAAHCVYSPTSNALLKAEDLTFRAGLRHGTSAAERQIAQIEAHPGYTPGQGSTAENIRHDVAYCGSKPRSRPICSIHLFSLMSGLPRGRSALCPTGVDARSCPPGRRCAACSIAIRAWC